MSTTPIEVGAVRADSVNPEFAARAVFCLLAVLICYAFQWHWLRSATLQSNMALDALLGVHLNRIAPDAVLWNGGLYRYVISCTFADVWCGALAFIIDLRRGVLFNFRRLAIFTVLLFPFNIVRLSLSDFLIAHGTPWVIGHEIFAGIFYYAVWKYLWHTRTWGISSSTIA